MKGSSYHLNETRLTVRLRPSAVAVAGVRWTIPLRTPHRSRGTPSEEAGMAEGGSTAPALASLWAGAGGRLQCHQGTLALRRVRHCRAKAPLHRPVLWHRRCGQDALGAPLRHNGWVVRPTCRAPAGCSASVADAAPQATGLSLDELQLLEWRPQLVLVLDPQRRAGLALPGRAGLPGGPRERGWRISSGGAVGRVVSSFAEVQGVVSPHPIARAGRRRRGAGARRSIAAPPKQSVG